MRTVLLITLLLTAATALGHNSVNFTFETDHAKWKIGRDGRALGLTDKKSGINYAATPHPPFAHIKKHGKDYPATAAAYSDGKLTLEFDESGISATLRVTIHKNYIELEVTSVVGDGVEELAFVDFPTTLTPDLKATFAACALALNLKANVLEIPGPMSRLRAMCYSKFGLQGAKVALIACPTSRMREIMKQVVSASPDLPHSPLGGPWALDNPCNRESYLFNFGDLTEKTVDKWIELAKNLGITEIDFHGGVSFRFGDCRPNPKMYPNGRASLKAVIDKLHAAGIKAGLHTYAHFIHESCPWVTPVPDPGLAKDATFTLASAITESDDIIPVNESTQDMSIVTGFATRNSVVLQIDDELIIYEGISKEHPYAFTSCKRGAYGTKAAPHSVGAKVHHLKQCFYLFCPDGDSDLMVEVAKATADFYNECGFDMIYLDALDGEDVMGGPGEGWYYGSKFVFGLFKRLKKPPIMEMSTFHHHLWYVRSRMGAWDHPNRGYKTFVDIHCQANKACDLMFLPGHLGWWRTNTGTDIQKETTFPDDLEYVLAKCAAHQCGISPQEFTPESYASSYYLRRMAAIYKKWEELRLAGFFDEKMRAILAEPGQDFTLATDAEGKPCVRRVDYAKHKVEGLNHPSATWTVRNRFSAQPARMRIEGLASVASYDSPDAATLVDFSNVSVFSERDQSPGVTAEIRPSNEHVKVGELSGLFIATAPAPKQGEVTTTVKFSPLEHGQRVIHGLPDYCKLGMKFDPCRDLTQKTALGVWIYGDGQGEVLNIQLLSPPHMMSGYSDHYIPVNFTGWRYFELVEPEAERAEMLFWPYSSNAYAIYREMLHPNSVESLNLWYNLIPEGGTSKCWLSPIKALPVLQTKLVNPSVIINGKSIVFPVELPTGWWIEYNSAGDCKLYDANGNFVSDIKPMGEPPTLITGNNTVTFTCDPPADGVSARARVTIISYGPSIP